MASCLLPVDGDESVLVSGPVLRRLIGSGSGDAALLYLCLLRRRGEISTEQAGRELKWDRMRLQTAEDELRAMNLLGAGEQREAAPSPPPAYEREDVLNCLEHSEEFRCLTAEVERKLGKKLSTPDLGTLLGLYDYLGLPADVIYLLVCSTLADAVKREHDLGIVGEAKAEVERSGSQKALLVIGACTWLAYDIMRQSRGIEA